MLREMEDGFHAFSVCPVIVNDENTFSITCRQLSHCLAVIAVRKFVLTSVTISGISDLHNQPNPL